MSRRKRARELGPRNQGDEAAGAALWQLPWGQDLISFALAAGFTIRPVLDNSEITPYQNLSLEKHALNSRVLAGGKS